MPSVAGVASTTVSCATSLTGAASAVFEPSVTGSVVVPSVKSGIVGSADVVVSCVVFVVSTGFEVTGVSSIFVGVSIDMLYDVVVNIPIKRYSSR